MFGCVKDAVPFEVTGVDYTGPLYLRSGEKVWVGLLTCAIYHAVHLELTTSLSTQSFMQVLRRFVARRGRPKTIYSDRSTNFVGTEGAFSKLDWTQIAETSAQPAPWWGGFWERLIGILIRLLGRASLNYEELLTIICDCEAVINSKPLTYMSSDPSDLTALTPSMFLHDQAGSGVPECDLVDRDAMCRRLKYRQRLQDNLRHRFRNEYLGQLKLMRQRSTSRVVTLGEVVLIGKDQEKRLVWPLGRIREIIPGKDGVIRLVRVETAREQLLRPIQRSNRHRHYHRLMKIVVQDCLMSNTTLKAETVVKTTRSGRIIKSPSRYPN
ncbi:hypothetical protein NQ315_014019 [Exocentrus adspersus]|uniref:Integrase catalytic domain-containing protein n=1 Tax=Exocentrus adspersus TaxID=1586481 RepID=A0AAV8V6D8_9CUCU|nr:hypothetical protein NQ315_014019 [Exocentrus adspersus]